MTLPGWRTEEFSQLPSTQESIKQRLRAGEDVDGLVVRAAEQPAGKGRRGKAWASPPGGSYQSLAVKDRWDGALRRPVLTLLLAVCIAEELRAAGAKAKVKWPNDVYLGEGKLAGVLSEYQSDHLIVGIGVNVNNPVPDGGSALRGWELGYVSGLVLTAAHAALSEQVRGEGHPATDPHDALRLSRRFALLDHLAGRNVTVSTASGAVTGVAMGVNGDGELLVRTVPASTVAVSDGTVLRWG